MQLQLKPSNKLTYKLRLTPQMRLGISLLQMPLVKLKDYIQQQIEQNPLLETDSFRNNESLGGEDMGTLQCSHTGESDECCSSVYDQDEDKQNYKQGLLTKSTTLSEHLLNQLHLLVHSDKEEKIGELIIANIDENGYLKSSIEEIVESTQATPAGVEKVLSLVQTFDPIGVGARDLRECLLLQIKGHEDSLVEQIISNYLPYLEKKRFEFIAKKLKVPVERIKKAIKEIANLEPKPGRSFNPLTKDFGVGVNTETVVRLVPDLILKRDNDTYKVMLNDWELPSLNLNHRYKRMLKQKDIREDTKDYLREKLKNAQFLITAINNRKQTLKKVVETIVYLQKDFLDKGMQSLKPMTLSQIARLAGKHKSTVSRTISNKYLQTPDGIFQLRQLLNAGVKQKNGEFFSTKAIKSKIKELIENENKQNPLSDQQITNHFKQEGIAISRRTIAKYRAQLKVLPSQSRKE